MEKIDLVNQLMGVSSMLYDSGDYAESISKLVEAWNILPEDKYQYKESYHIIQRILSTAIMSKDYETMMQYLPHIFKASPGRPDYGGREFWAGRVYYEMGDMEKSYQFFQVAYKKSNRKCFDFEDEKYLKFFLTYKLRF